MPVIAAGIAGYTGNPGPAIALPQRGPDGVATVYDPAHTAARRLAGSLMNDHTPRRAWLMPPASGVVDGIDLSLLDPAEEGDRHFLLLAEHPELAAAIDNDEDGARLEGSEMSPRLHLAMHEVVANQLWDDNPPEMWTAAQRLTQAGYERHEVLHMLASVVSADIYNAMTNEATFDITRTRRALAALPDS